MPNLNLHELKPGILLKAVITPEWFHLPEDAVVMYVGKDGSKDYRDDFWLNKLLYKDRIFYVNNFDLQFCFDYAIRSK